MIFPYISSFILAAMGAFLVHRSAGKIGLIDHPNKRSSHKAPTPKGGGIGILAAFVLTSFTTNIPSTYWLPITIVSVFSLYGDRKRLAPRLRLCIQFTASFAIVLGGLTIKNPLLILFFTVFIVGTANCYNFMDGINGIAAITGLIGFFLVGLYSYIFTTGGVFFPLTIATALACAGFLPFNIPRAKVFMGDVGSILLGFLFGTLVLVSSQKLIDFVCLTSFLFPFYSDEIMTKIVQILDGEVLTQPHRKHLYQLLVNEMGIDHWKISVSYGLLQLVIGVSVMVMSFFGSISVFALLTLYLLIFIGFNLLVRSKVKATQ